MHVIHATNVNQAYQKGCELIFNEGEWEDTRGGPVFATPFPVTTVFTKPRQRLLFNTVRDANPFFHLAESLWMLAGRNDVKPMSDMVKRMAEYSDDGVSFHGAYGFRWRNWFQIDQIDEVVKVLETDPWSRRAMIQMWDATTDLGKPGKDFPCNVGIHFQLRNLKLDMTVFNRSNDMVMGAYGANVVHMSMLQEYVANQLKKEMGNYYQVSDNFHCYSRDYDSKVAVPQSHVDLYEECRVVSYPYICNTSAYTFKEECNAIVDGNYLPRYQNSFLDDIGQYMVKAYRAYKAGDVADCVHAMNIMPSGIDWTVAGKMWLARRGVQGLTNVPC